MVEVGTGAGFGWVFAFSGDKYLKLDDDVAETGSDEADYGASGGGPSSA